MDGQFVVVRLKDSDVDAMQNMQLLYNESVL